MVRGSSVSLCRGRNGTAVGPPRSGTACANPPPVIRRRVRESVWLDERATLEEAKDSLQEAGQRIRSVQNRMRSDGMDDLADYRDLFVRITTALASTEAAYLEARRRRQFLDRQGEDGG